MIRTILRSAALLMSAAPGLAMAQQAPWNAKDMPVSHRDRVYASEQFSHRYFLSSVARIARMLSAMRCASRTTSAAWALSSVPSPAG